MATVAERACRHLHAPEWGAPSPRQTPCTPCVRLAEAVTGPPRCEEVTAPHEAHMYLRIAVGREPGPVATSAAMWCSGVPA